MTDLFLNQYECLGCGHRWSARIGPALPCLKCCRIYVRWINYSEDLIERRKVARDQKRDR